MAVATLTPSYSFQSYKSSTTYSTATGAGATSYGASSYPYHGQQKIGSTFYCWQTQLELSLTTFDKNDVVTSVTMEWAMDDFTSTAWTLIVRHHESGWSGSTEAADHIGGSSVDNDTRLFNWVMAGTADNPKAGESWTTVTNSGVENIVTVLNTLIAAGTDQLQVYLHSSDQQNGVPPGVGSERMAGYPSNMKIYATYTPGPASTVTANGTFVNTTMEVTLEEVLQTTVPVAAEMVPITMAITDNGGPVTVDIDMVPIEIQVTTVRGYNRDSLYGVITEASHYIGELI